jgi:hypothetical protein
MAKLYFKRSGTTYSSLLVPASSGLLVRSGGVNLGVASTSGNVPIGNYLKFTKSGTTKNVYINNNYTTYTELGYSSFPEITTNGGYFHLAYGNGIFVFYSGTSNKMYTSTTAASGSWTDRGNANFRLSSIYTVYFIAGAFYASTVQDADPDYGQYGYSRTYRSVNGITWTEIPVYNENSTPTFFYNGTILYMYYYWSTYSPFGYETWTSTDQGATWTKKLSRDSGLYLNTVVSINNTYFALRPSTTWLTSTDLANWSEITNPLSSVTSFRNFSFWVGTAEAKLVIFPSGMSSTYYYSSNGTTWTSSTFPDGAKYGNNRFFREIGGIVYLFDSSATTQTSAYVTINFSDWMQVTISGLIANSNTTLQESKIGVFSGITKSFLSCYAQVYLGPAFLVSDGT